MQQRHAWRSRLEGKRAAENRALIDDIRRVHEASQAPPRQRNNGHAVLPTPHRDLNPRADGAPWRWRSPLRWSLAPPCLPPSGLVLGSGDRITVVHNGVATTTLLPSLGTFLGTAALLASNTVPGLMRGDGSAITVNPATGTASVVGQAPTAATTLPTLAGLQVLLANGPYVTGAHLSVLLGTGGMASTPPPVQTTSNAPNTVTLGGATFAPSAGYDTSTMTTTSGGSSPVILTMAPIDHYAPAGNLTAMSGAGTWTVKVAISEASSNFYEGGLLLVSADGTANTKLRL